MISKVIQKEKEQQEKYIKQELDVLVACHKQSLVNLRKYMEDVDSHIVINYPHNKDNADITKFCKETREQLRADIKEIIKMIDRYE